MYVSDIIASDMTHDHGSNNLNITSWMLLFTMKDGEWHMIALTTLIGEPGFAFFLDGYKVAELNSSTGGHLQKILHV